MKNKPQQSLPPGLADDVERGVMDYVQKHPAPPAAAASTVKLVSALTVMAILVIFVFGTPPPKARYQNTDFVEQQFLLDNHTAIWLTPIEHDRSPEVPR